MVNPLQYIFLSIIVFTLAIIGGIHKIDEGHIGVYTTLGILQDEYTEAGFNWQLPIISSIDQIQITVNFLNQLISKYIQKYLKMQTDAVSNIPCGTSGGVMIWFEKIEVVNRLNKNLAVQTIKNYTILYDKLWIYDKIHHEINQFCTQHTLQEIYIDFFDKLDERLVEILQKDLKQWAPGIEIIAIRVTKPRIPASIRQNFEEMEQKRTQYLLESEKQNVILQQVRSQGVQAEIKAYSELEVAEISIEREINERNSEKQLSFIQDEILYKSEIARIDSHVLTQQIELETAQMRLTNEYLEIEAIKALSSNVKYFIGDQIPSYVGKFEL